MNRSDFRISYDRYYDRSSKKWEFVGFGTETETEQTFGVDDIRQIDVYDDVFSDITLTDGKIVGVVDIITKECESSIETVEDKILGTHNDHVALTDRESIEKYFNALAISLVLS